MKSRSLKLFVLHFLVPVVLVVLLPHEARGQDLVGGPTSYAAAFRELAVPGTRQFPPGLLYRMVHRSEGERQAVEALADTMVVVALDLAADLTEEGEGATASRETLRMIVRLLHAAGNWPATARRGSRFEGAGERLIRIAVEMPMVRHDPVIRSIPLRWLASLPDADRWQQELVNLARGRYPVSAAAVAALWDMLQGEGRELVTDMYRRGELVDARTRAFAEFVSGGVLRSRT